MNRTLATQIYFHKQLKHQNKYYTLKTCFIYQLISSPIASIFIFYNISKYFAEVNKC